MQHNENTWKKKGNRTIWCETLLGLDRKSTKKRRNKEFGECIRTNVMKCTADVPLESQYWLLFLQCERILSGKALAGRPRSGPGWVLSKITLGRRLHAGRVVSKMTIDRLLPYSPSVILDTTWPGNEASKAHNKKNKKKRKQYRSTCDDVVIVMHSPNF